MTELTALWLPIVVSAVLVLIALLILHMMPGWHKSDMRAVPDEDRVMEALRSTNIAPGEYRFPYGTTVKEMEAPEFKAKMAAGPVGNMTIRPNGEMHMGKMLGQWFIYSLVIATIVAFVTGCTHARGAAFGDVFCISGVVTFCAYSLAHWQNWIWWDKGTRFTITNTIDGVIYALVTGATFAWLWPR